MQVMRQLSSHACHQMSAAAFPIASVVASATANSTAELCGALSKALEVCRRLDARGPAVCTAHKACSMWLPSGLSATKRPAHLQHGEADMHHVLLHL